MSTSLLRMDPLMGFPTLDRLFGSMLGEPETNGFTLDEGTLALDISENDQEVIVRASLPGFTKDQVEIEAHDGVLTIKAEKTEETETKDERFYRKERRIGSVSRRIALPSVVKEADAHAELENGELILRLPKEAKAQPKRIAIN